jgi:uncharacterized protein (TIGR03437 family)
MRRQQKIYAAKCVVALSVVPALIYGFSSGPDPRHTGAPGDQTCARSGCHSGTVNPSGGSLAIAAESGTTYTPGARQRITITITDPTNRVFGFQASARSGANDAELRARQAGSFTPNGTTQQVTCEDGRSRPAAGCPSATPVEFIEHTQPSQSNVISFDWTAPATDVGPVRIYVAANAANGNGRADSGDRIYTANITLTPQAAGGTRPAISQGGVVNGASFQPGIVPGSWVTIRGTNLSSTTRQWAGNEIIDGRLPTNLDGVSVTINGKEAAVNFISPTQINVQAPDDAPGPAQVVVRTRDGVSDTFSSTILRTQPAFFLFGSPANLAAVHTDGFYVGPANFIPGAAFRPARPGDTILLYATGLGPTNPEVPAGRLYQGAPPVRDTVRVRFGTTDAQVTFAGLSGFIGLYQINVVVPNVPDGDQQVVMTVGDQSSPAATLRVQR